MVDEADVATEYAERLTQQGIESRIRYEGVSAYWCQECGSVIPFARRRAVPGTELCVECAEIEESKYQINGRR